jgi:carbonic anhydrase
MATKFKRGVTRFQRGYFRRNREQFRNLVQDGQNPSTLFITCADSRIVPHALTHSEPGDLFVLRNVGNLVPAYAANDPCAAVGSAIEYSVVVLGVEHIIVCGHSHCGACAALYAGEETPGLTITRQWLRQGREVRDLILQQSGTDDAGAAALLASREQREQVLRSTERAMVVQQLRNLESYDVVAERVRAGTLTLHGWYYEIETGTVEEYDPERPAFVPLSPPEPALLRRAAG